MHSNAFFVRVSLVSEPVFSQPGVGFTQVDSARILVSNFETTDMLHPAKKYRTISVDSILGVDFTDVHSQHLLARTRCIGIGITTI